MKSQLQELVSNCASTAGFFIRAAGYEPGYTEVTWVAFVLQGEFERRGLVGASIDARADFFSELLMEVEGKL